MCRSTRHVSLIALTVAAAACGGDAGPEADVVIAPAALAQELADNRAVAIAAYDGRVLELSGTVGEKVQPGGLNPTLGITFAEIDDQLAFDADLNFVRFDPEDPDARAEFDALSVGDAVTVHCTFRPLNATGTLLSVGECRVR